MHPLNILVVSADPARRDDLRDLVERGAHNSIAVASAGAAVAHLERGIDAIVLDLTVPGLELATLRHLFSSVDGMEPDSLDAAERRHLSLVLRHTAGNKRKAAHILGISRSTLLNKVRKYGLERG
jgi:DNA-binding NtrC family response regulator